MIQRMPYEYSKYIAFMETPAMSFKHAVVDVSATPPDILKYLRNMDRQHFEYDGEHLFEFLQEKSQEGA